MSTTRRSFLKIGAGGAVACVLGFDLKPAYAQARDLKISRTTETRSTCPYCSVGCGIIIHGLGDRSKNARTEVVHIEGDPDHPVNRGTLCPKGSSLLDFVKSENRLKFPEYRGPGETEWKRVSWDWALDRIARLMKDDRDRSFTSKNDAGLTVNRWLTCGFLAASASSTESGYLTNKVIRALGLTALDNQARV